MPQLSSKLAGMPKQIEMISDKNKRINLKSKRTRTLFRKAIEVSKMCNLDIFIFINDRDSNRIIEYNSANGGPDADQDLFSIDRVLENIKRIDSSIAVSCRSYKKYTDTDYESLK